MSSRLVIDACVHPLPDGGYRLWYKDEAAGSHTWAADSPDLEHWQVVGPVPTHRPHEGPNMFVLGGWTWLVVDEWRGQGVYRSPDLTTWTATRTCTSTSADPRMDPMRYLDLPDTARISRLGLGTWQFGSREWGYGGDYADAQAARIVHRALDLGVTTFDTAEIYGSGRSERILGGALAGRRSEAYVATKHMPLLPLSGMVERRGRASRDRLGIDRIDLYQVHQANPVTPDTVLMAGMEALQDAGVVKDVGVSNYDLRRWRVAEAALGRRVLSNQVSYSLVDRGPEADLLPYAQEHDRVVIAYSPLSQGFLSARYDESNRPSGLVRRANPLFLPDNLRAARPLFGVLRDVATRHGATPAQVALAWLLHQPNVVVIPGAASVEQVESNVEAAGLDLTADEVAELRAAAEAFHPVTGRAAVPGILRNLRG